MGCLKRISIILAAALFMFSLMGCQNKNPGSTSAEPSVVTDPTISMTLIGISMAGAQSEGDEGETICAALEQAGYTVELAYASGDSDVQASQLTAMVEDGASALIVQAIDGVSASKALKQADVSGVKVLACGTPLDDSLMTYYIGCDWQEVGRMQARQVVETLELDSRKDAVTVEFLSTGSAGGALALEGALEILQPYIDAGTVTVPSGNLTAETCSSSDPSASLQELLSTHYQDQELSALFCLEQGVAESAINTLVNDYRGGAFPVVVGTGYTQGTPDRLEEYLLHMTVMTDLDNFAQDALDIIQAAVADSSVELPENPDPVAVTRDNVQELLVDSGRIPPETSGNATTS